MVKEMESAIWGQGFPAPSFDAKVTVLEQRILKDKHLKLKLSKGGEMFDAIWFFQNKLISSQSRLVYSLGINEYNGRTTVQMLVKHAEDCQV